MSIGMTGRRMTGHHRHTGLASSLNMQLGLFHTLISIPITHVVYSGLSEEKRRKCHLPVPQKL